MGYKIMQIVESSCPCEMCAKKRLIKELLIVVFATSKKSDAEELKDFAKEHAEGLMKSMFPETNPSFINDNDTVH